MSPRSQEFMDQARDRPEPAREVLASGHLEPAVSSPTTRCSTRPAPPSPRTTSTLALTAEPGIFFRIHYVTTNAFDTSLFTLSQHAQVARKGGDYAAVTPRRERQALRRRRR